MTHVVLLSGGSGTRLWPLSNSERSKQFLKVLRDGRGEHVSMVQRVFGQIEALGAGLDVTIATSAAQAEALAMQVGGRYALSLEPERRDTAPAIMLACAHLELEQGASPDDPVVVMPIDTFADQAYYDRVPDIAAAVASGASELVLLGVEPTYPSEKYGYVIPASRAGAGPWPVEEFREKPSEAEAAAYIARGGLWNCGVFGFRLGWLRALTRAYLDEPTYAGHVARYRELPRNSFDYEVVEGARSVSVLPYAGTWKDLGTWNTLTEEMAEPVAGRAVVDAASCPGTHVINETGLPMVVAGVAGAVVVATPDGILVTGKEESKRLKGLVEEASEGRPRYGRGSWGEWAVLRRGGATGVVVRELAVAAGASVRLAPVAGRWERLVVASGEGSAEAAGRETLLAAGSSLLVSGGEPCVLRALTDMVVAGVSAPAAEGRGRDE